MISTQCSYIHHTHHTRIHTITLAPQVTNENLSHYLKDNCKTYGCDQNDEEFEESNLMHNMNGRMYANLEGLEMTVGDSVRWFVAAFGTEVREPFSSYKWRNVL
jgi:hypothetical protein